MKWITEAEAGHELPRFTRAQEHRLALESRAGDAEARRQLVLSQLLWAGRLASRFKNRGLPYADLFQQAVLTVLHCVDRFDPGRGHRLTTYVQTAVWRELQRLLGNRGSQRRALNDVTQAHRGEELLQLELLDADAQPLAHDGDPAPCVEAAELAAFVKAAVARLPYRERLIIQYFMGGHPDRVAGQLLNIGRERVRQLRQRAFERLRESLSDLAPPA